MTNYSHNLSPTIVPLPVIALMRMIKLVRLLNRIRLLPSYLGQIYPQSPDVARYNPGHDAVMMCYDFHLENGMPRLIEVNTNAGGGMLAYLAKNPSMPAKHTSLSEKLKNRLLQTFADEMFAYSSGCYDKPTRIVILDETPDKQPLYAEMCAFADLFRDWGVPTDIVAPQQLTANHKGVWLDGKPVDMIYNRHCDFYLQNEELAGLRQAYLAGKVCLTPNPYMYFLLADKRRMILWSDPASRTSWDLSEKEGWLLDRVVPKSFLLADLPLEQAWLSRKQYVFKPVDSYGSRGVLIGAKMTRKRFDGLPMQTTLVQDWLPPSMTETADHELMKTDFRLFVYRNRVFGITARLYRGQVTNMNTPGGGFARIRVV